MRLADAKTPESILRYLQGITFPVKKDDVVHAARQNGAPNDIIAALSALPITDIKSQQELIDAYPDLSSWDNAAATVPGRAGSPPAPVTSSEIPAQPIGTPASPPR